MEISQNRWERVAYAVQKLAGWNGISIHELIEEGYLEEGDLD